MKDSNIKISNNCYISSNAEINFGIKKYEVNIEKEANVIKRITFNDSNISIGYEYASLYTDNNEYRLGPLIGLFVSNEKKLKLSKGKMDNVYKMLTMKFRKFGGILVVFSINNLDIENKLIKGLVITDDSNFNTLTEVVVPLPRIIYDRCFSREEALILRDKLHDFKNIKILNYLIKLGKIEVYDLFKSNPILKELTIPYKVFTTQNLKKVLDKYDEIYIKPDKLYKGEGIVKVKKDKERFTFKYHTKGEYIEKESNLLVDVYEFINDYGDLSSEYVIQKAITSPCFLGNHFDIRVLLQKGLKGNWEVTGKLARIAPDDGMITSPRSGGKVFNLNRILEEKFTKVKANEINTKIDKLCKFIGYELEKKYGYICELGIDLGIDTKGNLWLFEVNGKPLKVSLKRLRDGGLYYKVNTNLALYFSYLDGYKFNEEIFNSNLNNSVVSSSFELKTNEKYSNQNIRITPNIIKQLNIDPTNKVTIILGNKSIECNINTNENIEDDTMEVSKDIINELGLYSGIKLNVSSTKKNIISLGPIIGYIINNNIYKELKSNNPSEEIKYLTKISEHLGCLICYFTIDNINFEDNCITACNFNYLGEKWEENILPFSDVIYNKATYTSNKLIKKSKKIINKLKKMKEIRFINYKKEYKRNEVYEALRFFKDTKYLIPEKYSLEENTTENMFEIYPVVFKEIDLGSKRDITIKIAQLEAKHEIGTGTLDSKNQISSLKEDVKEHISDMSRRRNIIIQQGINLISDKNEVFDCRILVQKNNLYSWNMSLIAMRLAPENYNIKSMALGGEILTLDENKLEESMLTISYKDLEEFSIKCAKAIECYLGPVAELGLEVGLDKYGKLYLIEANGIPHTEALVGITEKDAKKELFISPLKHGKELGNNNSDVYLEDLVINITSKSKFVKIENIKCSNIKKQT